MEIKRWTGIRNDRSEDRFRPGELMSATDVELDNTGKIMSRKGYTRVSSTAMRSIYNNGQITLAVAGANLVRVNADFSLTTLTTTGSASLPVSYDTVAGVVYWSNGVRSGRIVNGVARQWGVTPPLGQPQASATTSGALPPGKYLYAMTFLRADGHESGTGATGSIELTARGGIQFTGLEVSTNPEISGRILYLSSVNGETVYRIATLGASETSYLVHVNRGTVPLMTQFKSPPPAGSIVRYYNGSMYVVVGDAVYRSDPYELELFKLDQNYLRFPGPVVLFECVNDGIYVATPDVPGEDSEAAGETFYLAGADPSKSVRVFDHGAIPGTATVTDAGFLEGSVQGDTEGMQGRPAVLWASRFGICAGFDGGVVQNYTEAKYSFPVAQRGVGMVRQDRGFAQFIVALQDVSAANNEYTR